MQNKGWMMRWGPMLLVLALTASAHGLEADFEPSTYNPAVGEIITFAVCESCTGAGSFTYAWDFTGDGKTDLETTDPWVTYAFDAAGFYQVQLRVIAAGGRAREVRKGVVVGEAKALGIRSIVVESDGSLLVLIRVNVHAQGSINIEEKLPAGWMAEVVETGGAMVRHNGELRQLEVAWMSSYYPGESVTLSYRLRRGSTSTLPPLHGEVQGYFGGKRFTMPLAGVTGLSQ